MSAVNVTSRLHLRTDGTRQASVLRETMFHRARTTMRLCLLLTLFASKRSAQSFVTAGLNCVSGVALGQERPSPGGAGYALVLNNHALLLDNFTVASLLPRRLLHAARVEFPD